MKNSTYRKIIFLSFVILFLITNCKLPFLSKEEENNNDELLLLGLAALLSQSQQIEEPRPFRGRSVFSYGSTSGAVVYDWNVDRGFSPLANVNPVSIQESDSGRFSTYSEGTQFRIIDTGINLSPHGEHYHVDKSNPRIFDPSHAGVSLDIAGTNPVRGFSYNGKSAFTYANGQIRVLEEKTLVDENTASITINTPTSLPTSHNGITIWMNEGKVIWSIDSNTISFRSGGIGSNFGTNDGNQTCSSWLSPAGYRFAQSGNNFSNLNLTYLYDHYLVFPCSSEVLIVKHTDSNSSTGAGTYSFPRIATSGQLSVIKPLFANNNYSLGGKSTQAIFYGNYGSNSETSVIRINASNLSLTSKPIASYRSSNIVSEEKEGKEILVLDNQGQLHVLNSESLETITTQQILPDNAVLSGGNAPKLFGTWDASFILYQTNSGEAILQEFNVKERVATRKITLPRMPSDISFHSARSKGSDYTGPLP